MKREEFERQARRVTEIAALTQLVSPGLREAVTDRVAQLGEMAASAPHAARNGRPHGPARWRRNAQRAAQIAVLTRLVVPMVREAASDRKVRRAARDTYGAGWRLYEDLRGSDAKRVAARMARDERLQSEIAALVRSATNAVDEGITSGHRHARRRLLRLLMAATAAAFAIAIALRQRFPDRP